MGSASSRGQPIGVVLLYHSSWERMWSERIGTPDAEVVKHVEQAAHPPTQPSQPDARNVDGSPGPTTINNPAPLDWSTAVKLLDTIPGIGQRLAQQLVAEIGTDMSRFPSEAHITSWAKLSPGNNEIAGKRYSGRTGHGNRWLRTSLIQAAHAAVKVKKTYLRSFYYRLAGRRGAKRAIVAVAHRITIAAYYMLLRREPFKDLGAAYLDERNKTKLVKRMTRRIEHLGYRVIIEPSMPLQHEHDLPLFSDQ